MQLLGPCDLLRGHRSTPRTERREAMPILECQCGMVMSVLAAHPRARCIRCGSVELGRVEAPATRATDANSAHTPSGDQLPLLLQMVGEAAVHVASGV
jgi:hypothetical protein